MTQADVVSVGAGCAEFFFGEAFVTGALFAATFLGSDFLAGAFFTAAFLAGTFLAGAAGAVVAVVVPVVVAADVVVAVFRLATESATDLAAVATNTARVASRLRVNVSTCFSK